MKKALLCFAALLLIGICAAFQVPAIGSTASGSGGSVTWSIAYGPVISSTCTSTSDICTLTIPTVTAGDIGVCGISNAVGDTISGCSLNGSAADWWFYLNGFTSCYLKDSASSFTSDCGYILSIGSGQAGSSIPMVAERSSSTPSGWRAWYVELHRSSGSATLDVAGTRDQTTNTTSPAGVTLSGGTGTNDGCAQSISAGTVSGVNSPWSTASATGGSGGAAAQVGVAYNVTAPTWTTSSNKAALSAICFQ